ncbi:restriction endonuclease subunit S [Planctomycetota bacterium]
MIKKNLTKKKPEKSNSEKLGEIAYIIMGQSPKGNTYNKIGEGYPLLNGPTEFGARNPLPALWTTKPTRFCDEGDILFCVRGSTTGRMNWADRRYCIGRGIGAFRARTNIIDTRFLYYSLRNNLPRLLSLCAGSVFPNLSRSDIESFKITWFDEKTRYAIAHILGTLDDKIELNRRMNETLEAMARAIFKSWFVDFDPTRAKAAGKKPQGMNPETAQLFPNRFQDSPLGKIPKGWKVGAISELVEIIGGGTPKTSVPEYWSGDIPWFSVVDAPNNTDVFVIETEKKVTSAGVENSSTKILPEDTTIISARGTVGKCAVVGKPMAFNQSCYGLRPKNHKGCYFLYFLIRNAVDDLQRSGHGSVFNTITRNTFETIDIPLPDSKIIEKFDQMVKDVLARIKTNLKETITLAALRDALLPKLLSGEIRIKNVENYMGKV